VTLVTCPVNVRIRGANDRLASGCFEPEIPATRSEFIEPTEHRAPGRDRGRPGSAAACAQTRRHQRTRDSSTSTSSSAAIVDLPAPIGAGKHDNRRSFTPHPRTLVFQRRGVNVQWRMQYTPGDDGAAALIASTPSPAMPDDRDAAVRLRAFDLPDRASATLQRSHSALYPRTRLSSSRASESP